MRAGASKAGRAANTASAEARLLWRKVARRLQHEEFRPTRARFYEELWREVGRADVVHAHGLVFVPSPLAMLFARCGGKHAVCTDHGGLLRYRSRVVTLALRVWFATAGRVTATAADRLVAYNADVEKLLCRLAGDRAKVRFVPNPVDPVSFRPPTPAQRAAARAALGWDHRPRVLCIARLLPHKLHPGNQPTSTLLFRRLDPRTLGLILALYEHKTFAQGLIWGVNSFDQWGVELGKQLASTIADELRSPETAGIHDSSTTGLLAAVRAFRG